MSDMTCPTCTTAFIHDGNGAQICSQLPRRTLQRGSINHKPAVGVPAPHTEYLSLPVITNRPRFQQQCTPRNLCPLSSSASTGRPPTRYPLGHSHCPFLSQLTDHYSAKRDFLKNLQYKPVRCTQRDTCLITPHELGPQSRLRKMSWHPMNRNQEKPCTPDRRLVRQPSGCAHSQQCEGAYTNRNKRQQLRE